MKGPVDVVALVFGLLLSTVAAAALWLAFAGSLDWSLVKIVAPLGLVLSASSVWPCPATVPSFRPVHIVSLERHPS